MSGSLIFRLERLEQAERDKPALNPLAALSDDELTVRLLETCAEIVASDCSSEDKSEARATAERIGREIEGWAAFWRCGGWSGEASQGALQPLVGNGIGGTERERLRRGEVHYRAKEALNVVLC